MISAFTVTFGLLILTFTLLFAFYWITVLRKIKGFPVYHVVPEVLRYLMTRKKDAAFTNFFIQMLKDMSIKHEKDGFCMSYSLTPMLYPFSQESFKMFLTHKAAANKPKEYKIIADGIGYGLVTSNGDRWKKHRKLMNPAFQLGMLKEKVPLFNEHAVALIEDMKKIENIPSSKHLDFIKRHYFNALSESTFGLKLSEENRDQFLEYYYALDDLTDLAIVRIFQPWLWFFFTLNFVPSGKRLLKLHEDLRRFPSKVILEMKKWIGENKEYDDSEYFSKNLHKSLTYILIQHQLKDPSFTFDDLHAHVNTFMAAGYDTVSYATLYCLFMLGLHPELQRRVFEEVQSTCHNYVTFEDMNSFTYLEAFIMETMRLYPPIPVFGRSLNEDVQYGKYKVHKGTSLVFSVYLWHRNPDNYPDPEKFDPERFLNGEERKPWQYIPFAEGNRVCIGKTYALIEMKIFLAHILRNFKITSLDKREDVELCSGIILTPAKPIRMLFSPRKDI